MNMTWKTNKAYHTSILSVYSSILIIVSTNISRMETAPKIISFFHAPELQQNDICHATDLVMDTRPIKGH